MKFLHKSSLLLLLGTLISKQALCQGSMQQIEVSNINKLNGDLYIGWYSDKESFRVNDKAVYREKVKVQNQDVVKVSFDNIPDGIYAIAVFLDENVNYELDRNIFGVPKEKYGFSNNIVPSLRPATFEEAQFKVNGEELFIRINLK